MLEAFFLSLVLNVPAPKIREKLPPPITAADFVGDWEGTWGYAGTPGRTCRITMTPDGFYRLSGLCEMDYTGLWKFEKGTLHVWEVAVSPGKVHSPDVGLVHYGGPVTRLKDGGFKGGEYYFYRRVK